MAGKLIALAGAVLVAALQGAPARAQPHVCTAELGAPPCEGAADPGSTPAAGGASARVGNPFDAVSGNKYQSTTDFRDLGSPLAFVRHYNSALVDRNDGLGRGWRHGYAVELGRLAGGGFQIRQADGRAIEFDARALPGAVPRRHLAADASDGWLEVDAEHAWVLPDGRRLAFRGPFLDTIDHADGRRLTIERDGARVLAVHDDRGRGIRFDYAAGAPGLARYGEPVQVPPGHLQALVLPNGERVEYLYDASLQLVSATDAAGRGARYGYASDDVPGLLASVEDDATGRVSRWRYEAGAAVEWHDPASGDGVVVTARDTAGPGAGTLEVHRADGDVDVMRWARDETRPLRPRVERRRVAGASRYAELAALPDASGPAGFRVGPSGSGAVPLVETRHAVRLRGRDIDVRVRADRFGIPHDIDVGGRRASDVARALSSGDDGRCTGARRAACLEEARELLEVAERVLDTVPTRPALAPRGRQHQVGGPACPLPAYVDCTALAHQREMAMLSSCAYSGGTCSTGYRRVSPSSLGLDAADMSFGSFHAELFEDPGTGRYVLAFRGSDDGGDWIDNGRNGLGLNSDQYARSARLASRIERQLIHLDPGSELELTGHSLGGGLATMAALATDRPATVFNAAAVHPDTVRWNGHDTANAGYLVDAVIVRGEPLSSGQRVGGAFNFLREQLFGAREHPTVGDVPGQRHHIPQPDEPWIQGYMASRDTSRALTIHSISAALRSLELLHDAHCTP